MSRFTSAVKTWLQKNVVGVVMVILTIMIYYEQLYESWRLLVSWSSGLLGVVAPFMVVVSGVVASGVSALGLVVVVARTVDMLFRFLVVRVVGARILALEETRRELERGLGRALELGDRRLAAVEERLRIGTYLALNLPDHLPPEVIRAEVRRYEREMGFRHLWTDVQRSLKAARNGYVVVEYNENKGGHSGSRASYFGTRAAAEADAGRGTVLVHVIESDWEEKNDHAITLDIDRIGDPLDSHRERRLDFMSVDNRPDGSCTFRFRLQKSGKDESTGREFDWWFERLQEACENGALAESGQGPTVLICCNSVDSRPFHQTKYEGYLSGLPRLHKDNRSLFEFDLRDVKMTATSTTLLGE